MKWKTDLPLIAIFRGITPDEVLTHVEAVIDVGFDAIEIPLNSPEWEISIPLIIKEFGSTALLGAGTVLKAEQVDMLMDMGCRFIVTPNTDIPIIRRANRYGMTVCAGYTTTTEAFSALDAGCHALKLFPAAALGVDYIKAQRAVIPNDIPIFAVGGVSIENLPQWLNAGCIGAGLGSELYRPRQTVEQTRQQAVSFINVYNTTTGKIS